jgi:hypothetical protein
MPIALMFFIAILAETNRPPFDLPEAESELVAGFMTEHGASIFVFFFLGEYSSLILMSGFMAIFFLGGHHCPDLHKLLLDPLIFLFYFLERQISPLLNEFYNYFSYYEFNYLASIKSNSNLFLSEQLNLHNNYMTKFSSRDTLFEFINIFIDKIYGSYILGFKIIIVVFFFI